MWSVCRAPICGASDQDQVQAELEPREKPLSNARHWTLTLTHPVRIFPPHPTLTLPLHPIILSFCIFVHPILPFGSGGNRRFESLLHCHCCSSLKLLESGLWTLLSAQCSLVKRLSSEPLLFCHPLIGSVADKSLSLVCWPVLTLFHHHIGTSRWQSESQ